MKKESAEKVGRSATVPMRSEFPNKSLTLMLMTMPIVGDPKLRKEFDVKAGSPDAIHREIFRYRHSDDSENPATMIHADRIRELSCTVTNDVATGTFSFAIPNGYAGEVRYVARKEKNWEIIRFDMPAHGIHIHREGIKGLWTEIEKSVLQSDEALDECEPE